jgi:hypothetical protein
MSMDSLSEQIIKIGRRIEHGELSEDEGRKSLTELRKSSHLSERAFKKFAKHAASKMKERVDEKQRELDVLVKSKEQGEQLGALLDAAKNDAIPTPHLVRQFKDLYPDIWSEVARRTYKHVDTFGNYQLAYLEWGWAHVLKQLKAEAEDDSPLSDDLQDDLSTFELHREYGFPFFFISQGIFDAAWQSDLKFAVDWKTMPLPFEAFTLVLPRINQVGYEAFILHRRVKDGDIKLKIVGLGKKALGEEIIVRFPFEARQDDAEAEAARWIFNTIYAMSARPEYVEHGERVGKRKGTQSEIWTPNIIGRKYSVKTRAVAQAEPAGSVRLHWRRGHFRQQAIGVGRSQHKTIWIEPMMVGK